jgi:hypothetical protein
MMSSHLSRLWAGTVPHPPHQHTEEEIIIVLSGSLEVSIGADIKHPQTIWSVFPGSIVFYRAEEWHTLRATGLEESVYLVFRWTTPSSLVPRTEVLSRVFRMDYDSLKCRQNSSSAMAVQPVFDIPTRYLNRLRSHLTVLTGSGGYAPHQDPFDIALVLLEGSIITAGRRWASPAVAFFESGVPHGCRNAQNGISYYAAFEFNRDG